MGANRDPGTWLLVYQGDREVYPCWSKYSFFVSSVHFSEFASDCNSLIQEFPEERKGYVFLIGQLEELLVL